MKISNAGEMLGVRQPHDVKAGKYLLVLKPLPVLYGHFLHKIVYLSLSSNIHIPRFGAGGEIGGSDIRVDFVERVF